MQNFGTSCRNGETAQQKIDHTVIFHHPKRICANQLQRRHPFSHNIIIIISQIPFERNKIFILLRSKCKKPKRPERTKINVLLSFAEPLNVALLPLSLPRLKNGKTLCKRQHFRRCWHRTDCSYVES